jgi:lysophospholipase L1-like esterase
MPTNAFPFAQVNKSIDNPIVGSGQDGNTSTYSVTIGSTSNVNIGSLTKSFNYFYKMNYIAVVCTTHDLDVRAQVAYNPNMSTEYSDTRHMVKKGITTYIQCDDAVIGNSGDARINVMGVYDPATGAKINTTTTPTLVEGTVSFSAEIELADKDVSCDDLFVAIGDSITVSETGITAKVDSMMWQIRYQLRKLYKRVRYVMKGVSGTTSANHLTLLKQGEYDLPNVKIFNILLGTNDAAQAVTPEVYIANITEIVAYLRAINPDAVIVLCGATPTDNNTWEALLAQYRTALAALVTSLTNPKTVYIDLSDSFARLTLSFYASSDSAGSKIHLSATGQAAVASNYMTKFAALGIDM